MTEIPHQAMPFGVDLDGSTRSGADGAPVPSGPGAPTYALLRAVEDVMAVRHQQIFTYGHTPEKDQARALRRFADDLVQAARAIVEDVQFAKPHDRIRRRVVKLAALALATIDRIDNEGNVE